MTTVAKGRDTRNARRNLMRTSRLRRRAAASIDDKVASVSTAHAGDVRPRSGIRIGLPHRRLGLATMATMLCDSGRIGGIGGAGLMRLGPRQAPSEPSAMAPTGAPPLSPFSCCALCGDAVECTCRGSSLMTSAPRTATSHDRSESHNLEIPLAARANERPRSLEHATCTSRGRRVFPLCSLGEVDEEDARSRVVATGGWTKCGSSTRSSKGTFKSTKGENPKLHVES